MDVAPSFPKDCDVSLGTPGSWLDLFSPDKGTENSNSNIAILFFCPLTPENENVGGSTICIHRGSLLEEAIVTHLVTGHGMITVDGLFVQMVVLALLTAKPLLNGVLFPDPFVSGSLSCLVPSLPL